MRLFVREVYLLCEASTAELVKLSENSYRDINIAFANELSIICSKYKINTNELIKLANKHPRVNIHNPGCGVGGHCIAVDPWFIASQMPNESKLIQKARETNLAKTRWVIKKIQKKVKEIKSTTNRIPKIGFLGLAYKANVDDLRESPALFIVKHFLNKKNKCYVCEPFLKDHKDIKLSSLKTVIQESDIIFFLVAHELFKNIDIKNKPFEDFVDYIVKFKNYYLTLKDVGIYRVISRVIYELKIKFYNLIPSKILNLFLNKNITNIYWLDNHLEEIKKKKNINIEKLCLKKYIIFNFLNEERKLSLPFNWNDQSWSRLWRFNLHYFEWSRQTLDKYFYKKEISEKIYFIDFLIDDWISNNYFLKGDGWHSYTISLQD